MVETFVLFGDPAMQLGLPPNYPYVESTTPADQAAGVSLNQNIQVTFSKPMSPTTVSLVSSGAASFTPTWNLDFTQVTYTHPNFEMGQTLVFTVTGQDNLENLLGTGSVSNPWSFTTNASQSPDSNNVYLPVLIRNE